MISKKEEGKQLLIRVGLECVGHGNKFDINFLISIVHSTLDVI